MFATVTGVPSVSISGSDTPFELMFIGSVPVVPAGIAVRRFR